MTTPDESINEAAKPAPDPSNSDPTAFTQPLTDEEVAEVRALLAQSPARVDMASMEKANKEHDEKEKEKSAVSVEVPTVEVHADDEGKSEAKGDPA